MRTSSASRNTWKLPLGLGLALLAVVTAVAIPTLAIAGSDAAGPASAAHAMAGHDMAGIDTAGLEDDLAQVRAVTARFHDLDEALAAGYELGWVNGSGVRGLLLVDRGAERSTRTKKGAPERPSHSSNR